MNIDIVDNLDLRSLMKEGAKFRENHHVDQEQVISDALAHFVNYCHATLQIDRSRFGEWCARVKEEVKRQCPPAHTNLSVLERPEVQKALRHLQRRFVVCVTDKADKNFSVICKNMYKYTLNKELQSENGAYRTLLQSPAETYQAYHAEVSKIKVPKIVKDNLNKDLREQRFKLPILYYLPKLHKPTPKARFIAASFDVMTTPLARVINCCLALIKKELKILDDQYFFQHGIKRCWFVDSAKEVTTWLRTLDRPADVSERCITTYDFSTMYTTLELDAIVKSVRYATNEAFGEGHKHMIFNGLTKPCTWLDTDATENSANCFTANDITNMVSVLVKNTYILNGRHLRQQTVGLPMGTNPAPHLADLTCFMYEARTVDQATARDPEEVRRFVGTCRYIDDILSVDNTSFRSYVNIVGQPPSATPIYPDFLALNETTDDAESADFLGMNISSTPKSFKLNIANTKHKFPEAKINYPNLKGNFPETLGYGVFIGQLHRFASICTAASDFVEWSVNMCNILLDTKGFHRDRLVRCFNGFVSNNSPYKTCTSTLCRNFRYGIHRVSDRLF
jgi:hypothetical protein